MKRILAVALIIACYVEPAVVYAATKCVPLGTGTSCSQALIQTLLQQMIINIVGAELYDPAYRIGCSLRIIQLLPIVTINAQLRVVSQLREVQPYLCMEPFINN